MFTYTGHTHENYPVDFQLGGSTYADVKGELGDIHPSAGGGTEVHIHGIVYSWNDGYDGDHAVGDYTLFLQVSMPDNVWDDDWWEDDFAAKIPSPLQGNFDNGVRREQAISFEASSLSDIRGIEYNASATVRNKLGTMRDFISKPIDKWFTRQ